MSEYSLSPLLVSEVDAVGGHDTLVLENPHVHLEGEQREHHEAEHRQRHHLHQLLDAVQQSVDDSLETCTQITER